MRKLANRFARFGRTALLTAFAFGGGVVTATYALHDARATPAEESPYEPFEQLASVMVLVETQYVEPAERDKMIRGAIRGLVAELDPHSAFMPADEFALFQGDTEGEFGGIGVEVDFSDDSVEIVAPIEGSPAERAGVRSGDKIVAVEGKPTAGMRSDKLIGLMRGKAGTSIRITLKRQGQDELIELTLVREVIQVKSVVAGRMDGDVGYLRIKQFQTGTTVEMLEGIAAIRQASSAPLRGVIIDLRSNPGGLVYEAEGVADELLNGGTIYSTRHRGKVVDVAPAHAGGALVDVPIVLLVDEYSASSSELVAGAVKDAKRATIVGRRTFGKGSVQTIFDLPGGAGMRLTTMRYYTPSGRSIQASGVAPQVLLEIPKDDDEPDAFREADLDGHLASEARDNDPPERVVTLPKRPDDAEPLRLPRASEDVPKDPRGGDDHELSAGYEELLRRMAS